MGMDITSQKSELYIIRFQKNLFVPDLQVARASLKPIRPSFGLVKCLSTIIIVLLLLSDDQNENSSFQKSQIIHPNTARALQLHILRHNMLII